MATQVYKPPRQQGRDQLTDLLTIGGGIVGGIYGGNPVTGAAAGAGVGQLAGGLMKKPEDPGPAELNVGASDALSRRLSKLDENPQMQIANSIDSLKYVQDPDLRAELAKPLLQAEYVAKYQPQQE